MRLNDKSNPKSKDPDEEQDQGLKGLFHVRPLPRTTDNRQPTSPFTTLSLFLSVTTVPVPDSLAKRFLLDFFIFTGIEFTVKKGQGGLFILKDE